MAWILVAREVVWQSYYDIPDDLDRREAWEILAKLVENPYLLEAKENYWTFLGDSWSGFSVDLSSGHGFVAYSPIYLENGTQAVRVWPMTWSNIDL